MVINHVKNHRDLAIVARLDETLEVLWRSVRRVDTVELNRIVPPVVVRRSVAGKSRVLVHWHYFNGVDSQIPQEIELVSRTLKGSCGLSGQDVEAPNMQLVDNHLVERGFCELRRYRSDVHD